MSKNIRFSRLHLEMFSSCLNSDEAWAGNRLLAWHEQVDVGFRSNLPNRRIDRNQLKALCADDTYTTRECVAAILAWGGMHRRHARNFFANYHIIEPTVNGLRRGSLNPDEAYGSFKQATDVIPIGIGPAYYTKLIFFLEPAHGGYIMDQWTAKSINLLRGSNVILTTKSGLVKPTNTIARYRNFRAEITHLSRIFNIAPENIEMYLFSIGGRNRGPWRRHVIKHWTPTLAASPTAGV